jgi:catechol 2,3-dioxygenase-like lactoylglutathione lyase family enzyme
MSTPRPRRSAVSEVKGFARVVFPARDLSAGVAAWTGMLGREPAFVGDDFAVFSGEGVEVGLTALPSVDHPLVFWKVDDVEDTHRVLVARGATPLGEIADGSLAELGAAEVTNGDPATGIVDLPGGRLAVLRAPDGNLIGLTQEAG